MKFNFAAEKHAVVRTDNMHGTYAGEDLVSCRYFLDGDPAPIENGNIVTLKEKMPEISRDMWKVEKPATNQKVGKLVLIASPEIVKEDNEAALDEFINAAGANCRGYILRSGDEFSVTAKAINGKADTVTNKYAEAAMGDTLIHTASAATNAFAELEAVEQNGGYTYYVYRVM